MNKQLGYMVRLGVLAVAVVAAIQTGNAEAAVIGTGNTLVLVRVGDGATALSGSAAAVFLEEYAITYTGAAPTGATHIQTIPVSATGATPGTKLTIGGTASLEGGLNFSTDGLYMMFGGYDSTVGQTASGGSNRRIVGRVDLAGNVTFDAIYGAGTTSANNALRSVTSSTGNEYWFGMSAASVGVSYRTWENGNNSLVASTLLNGANTRRVEIFNNQLYIDSAAGSIFGVATVGSGTPTTTGQTVSILPGMPTATGPSPVDFFFADANTLYLADDRTSTSGGLQKWTQSGGTWSLAYTKNIDTTNDTIDNGLRGLTGSVDASGNVTLFGTSTYGTAATANFLVGISDTLANANPANVTVNSLASSASIPGAGGSLATFRGLEAIGIVVPEPTGLAGIAAFGLLALSRRRRD